jgi:hypothetical protein
MELFPATALLGALMKAHPSLRLLDVSDNRVDSAGR